MVLFSLCKLHFLKTLFSQIYYTCITLKYYKHQELSKAKDKLYMCKERYLENTVCWLMLSKTWCFKNMHFYSFNSCLHPYFASTLKGVYWSHSARQSNIVLSAYKFWQDCGANSTPAPRRKRKSIKIWWVGDVPWNINMDCTIKKIKLCWWYPHFQVPFHPPTPFLLEQP